jgi:hypothetical protein
MNIDNLTFGQLKEISTMFSNNGNCNAAKSNLLNDAIGKYVIVRSYNDGVNAGYLEKADDTGCILTQCRRLWRHKPKNTNLLWFEGVAESGLSEEYTRVGGVTKKKYIIEKYSIVICSEEAEKSIKGFDNK